MSTLLVTRFHWVRDMTFREQTQNWRARQQVALENLDAANATARAAFATAINNLNAGLGSLATKAAAARMQSATKLDTTA